MNQMNVDTFPYRDPSDGTFVAHDYCDPDVVKVHIDYLMVKVVSHLVQDFFDTHRSCEVTFNTTTSSSCS